MHSTGFLGTYSRGPQPQDGAPEGRWGVETQEELEHMRREGCTEAQGYFFSRPRPAQDVYTLLAKQAGYVLRQWLSSPRA